MAHWFIVAGVSHSPFGFVLLGLGVGYLSGLFGVGGGFMLTPLLNSFFDIPFDIAVGSGLCQMIGASTTAVLRYRQRGGVDVKLAVAMMGGTITGVIVGARLIRLLDALGSVVVAGHSLSLLQLAMDVLFLGLLLWIARTILTEPPDEEEGSTPEGSRSERSLFPPGAGPAPHAALGDSGLEGASLPGLAYLGLAVGLLTGMLGVGGGVILIPLLIYGLRVPTQVALGTSLVLILGSAVTGTLAHALNHTVHLPIALAMLIGSTLGAQAGALSAGRIPAGKLRRWFGLIVLATAALLVKDLYQKLF